VNAYVVTEGAADAEFLRRILSTAKLPEFHVSSAGAKSSAISLAKSILLRRGVPVAVVLDADTLDEGSVAEQEMVYYDLLRPASPRVPFRVFFAVPALEGILFSDPAALSHIVGKPISAAAARDAEFRPAQVLQDLMGTGANGNWHAQLVERIQPLQAASLAKHPLVRDLAEFIRHPRAWSPEVQAA
jgi:hypothetical protein